MRNDADRKRAARTTPGSTRRGARFPAHKCPEDIVDVVAFLLTRRRIALTGQLIPVNAGFVFN